MFALQEVAPDLFWVALPTPEGLSQPWGVPRNVFVFTGDSPALLDTGYAETTPNLLAALDALGLAPEAIRRIGLTSLHADAAGALAAFPHATVWTACDVETAPLAHEKQRYAQVFEALLLHPSKPDTWTRRAADHFLALAFPPAPSGVRRLQDGQPLRLGHYIFDALQTEGVGYPSAAYFSADRGWLFPGPTSTLTPRPVIDSPGAILDSLGKLGAMSVKKVFPIRGLVENHVNIFFRTLSLYATNLRSNMQYVFHAPQSSIDLAESDFGYLPDDLPRFAALVLEYDAVFREFAEAGVIREDQAGYGPHFPRYRMGTPLASRGPASPR